MCFELLRSVDGCRLELTNVTITAFTSFCKHPRLASSRDKILGLVNLHITIALDKLVGD